MISRIAISLVATVVAASAACGQRPEDAEPLPKDPNSLVELMAGEDLPSMAGSRRIPDTPGWRAAAALIAMQDEAIPVLTKALASDDESVRLNAVFVLRGIGTPATLPLRLQAARDKAARVRALAVTGLPAYTSNAARAVLISAVNDPDPTVRNAAITAFQPPSATEPDNAVRFATANLLLPLLDDPATQYKAARTLGRLGMNVAARPLLKLLKAEDSGVRSVAIEALGKLKDQQVAVELTAALKDKDAYVRMNAAHSLGQIADLRATPALVELLVAEEPFLRRDAALAIGQIGDLRATKSLLPLLRDSDGQVRAAAAAALAGIGDHRAVEPLCALLASGEGDAASLARALGSLGDPRAIKPLADCLLTPRMPVEATRDAAAALAKFRHPEAIEALVRVTLNTDNSEVRLNSRRALGEAVGIPFSHEPNEAIEKWWQATRNDYLRPVP